jgi:hypothetical protein
MRERALSHNSGLPNYVDIISYGYSLFMMVDKTCIVESKHSADIINAGMIKASVLFLNPAVVKISLRQFIAWTWGNLVKLSFLSKTAGCLAIS